MKNGKYKIKNPPIFISGFPILVEMAGIEPASENLSVPASPSADALLKFPYKPAKRQADLLSSLNSVTAAEALRRSRSPLK